MLDWSLAAFQNVEAVAGIVLVLPGEYVDDVARRLKAQGRDQKLLAVIAGGEDRQFSVARGLKALPPQANWVAVHDAVRPFVTPQLIEATFTLAQQVGAGIPVVGIHDTLVQVDEVGRLVRPISRDAIKRSQTPQIFRADILADSHEKAAQDNLLFTDDATLVAFYGHTVATFVHHGENRKITTPADMEKITMQKFGQGTGLRCGQGYDAHRLEEGRPLILGGVRFPSERGLAGHSDADVLSHAICDALLGAAALGDIGRHFPDTDPAYRNISSLALLEESTQLVRERGYSIIFVDSTLICEAPRINTRREEMREKLAAAMGIDPECVSVKATTQEGMGFCGRGEGIAAMAIATLELNANEDAP